MMSDPQEGNVLPEATLESTEGKTLNLPADWRGKWALLYFYPKDDTPGCTKQACAYRDKLAQFQKLGVVVYGISGDSMEDHRAFIEKFQLNFPLLSDPERKLSEPLGVYGDQEWKGRVFQGLSRDSFMIDPTGKIRKVWRKVSPEETVVETYDELKKGIEPPV